MRSFLKYTGLILAFLAGLLAILILLSFLVNPKNNSQEAGMKDPTAVGFWGEPKNSIDVLVLGDSELQSGSAQLKQMATGTAKPVSLAHFLPEFETEMQNGWFAAAAEAAEKIDR